MEPVVPEFSRNSIFVPINLRFLSETDHTILEEMSNLDLIWLWYSGKSKPDRMIEAPAKTQSEELKAFGWEIIKSGVLQECVR